MKKTALFLVTLLLPLICQAQYVQIQNTIPPQKVVVSEGNTTVTLYLAKKENDGEKIQAIRGLVSHAIVMCKEDGCDRDLKNLASRIKARCRAMKYPVKDLDIEVAGKKYKLEAD